MSRLFFNISIQSEGLITSIANADIDLAKIRLLLDPVKHVSDVSILVQVALDAHESATRAGGFRQI